MTKEIVGVVEYKDSCQAQGSKLSKAWEENKHTGKYALLRALFSLHKWTIVIAVGFSWFGVAIETLNIYVLKEVMSYIDGEYDNINRALKFVFAMAMLEFISRCSHMARDRFEITRSKIAHGIQTLIFSKVFDVTSSSNKKYRKGELNGLVNHDPHRISHFLNMCSEVVTIPFAIASAIFSLYQIIGMITIYALTLLIAASIGLFMFSKLNSKLHRIMRRHDDERGNVLLEMVENMKVIKMNSYTQKFLDDIVTFKGKEYYHMIYGHLINFPSHLIHFSTHYGLVFGILFMSAFNSNMSITVPLGMTILRLIEHLKGRTCHLPHFIRGFYDSLICIHRIEDFLHCGGIEYHKYFKNTNEDNNISVKIEQSNFFWGLDEAKYDEEPEEVKKKKKKEKSENGNDDTTSSSENEDDTDRIVSLDSKVCLRDVKVEIKKGDFVAVIGEVGSGKSSLINAILGEMLTIENHVVDQFRDIHIDLDRKAHEDVKQLISSIKHAREQASVKSGPKLMVHGSVSLIEQTPFILNATIRDNILFGEELDEDRYNKVVEACQLGRDLEILKGGDLTEIGENGINLSGGQKARVSIARAVYANKDIILMDDPLSALDAHVKRKVFDKVCSGQLAGKTKILVTHAIDFLDRVDKIIIMDKGRIHNQGTYEELKDDEKFKQIIKHITRAEKKDEEEDTKTQESSEEDESKETKNYMSTEGHKITDREEDEKFTVTWKTYVSYASFGIPALIFLLISTAMMLVERSYSMYQEYLMMDWLKKFSQNKDPNYEQMFSVVKMAFYMLILSFSNHFCYIGQTYVLDSRLFKSMMKKLINAPINLYFDKTTTGKVLGRFQGDLSTVTRHLPGLFTWNIHDIFRILMTICLITYYSPVCLLVVPIVILSILLIMKDFVSFKKKMEQLYDTIGTPSHTHINESIEGTTTIRTFNKAKMFQDKFCELKDRDHSLEILDRS